MAEARLIKVAPWIGGCIVVAGLAVAGISLFDPEAFADDPPAATAQLLPFERAQIEDGRLTHGRDAGLKAAAGLAAVAAGLLGLAKFQQGRDDARRAEDDQKRADKAQFNQRFIDAVGMLGNDSGDIKLGGLYALEQLAIDSPGHRHAIIEVLCAYVREHSRQSDVSHGTDRVCHATVLVLGRQRALYEAGHPFDLSSAKLVGNFGKPILAGAILAFADLSDTTFIDTDLTGADLSFANLQRARLGGADLTGAYLAGANLTGANCFGANLSEANLLKANLTGASLDRATLIGAILNFANLERVTLRGANLTDADLTGADLTGATADDNTQMPEGWEKVVRRLGNGEAPVFSP